MSKVKYAPSMFIATTGNDPVFFDTHTSLYNRGLPVTTITGAPGQGKTYAGQVITTLSALMGKTVVVLDYKGDMLKIAFLAEELGIPLNIWNVADPTQKGVLDPFNLTNDKGEQLKMVLEVIELFNGQLDKSERSAILPVIKDVTESQNASLVKVVNALKGSQNALARNVGSELDLIRTMPFAHVCFSQNEQRKAAPKLSDGGLTIATLAGMELPDSVETSKTSNDGRLASGILYLLTSHIKRMLNADTAARPKLFVIDEAWAVLATPSGLKIVKEVALLGRSKNLATVLITQNPNHFASADIKSTIGNRFAFGASKKEAEVLVEDMGLPESQGFEDAITALKPQICLFADYKGDYGVIRFSAWRKDWLKSFSNNPHDQMEITRERKARERREASGE